MDEEKTSGASGGEGPPSETSTAKRVVALAAVAVLLVVGIAVIPMFLAGRQAEINRETKASNVSYSAAAELKIMAPTKGLNDGELQALTADSEFLKSVEVKFDVPYTNEDERAVLFFPSSDVSVEAESGKLEKTALSDGILIVWTPEGAGAGKLNVSEGAKNYVISLKKVEEDVFEVVVSASDNG
jgi:hypothetical protein